MADKEQQGAGHDERRDHLCPDAYGSCSWPCSCTWYCPALVAGLILSTSYSMRNVWLEMLVHVKSL